MYITQRPESLLGFLAAFIILQGEGLAVGLKQDVMQA